MEKVFNRNKIKGKINELQFINNYTSLDNTSNELPKKKTLKKYKFHMFHHNNILTKIKSTGIDMNFMDNILNSNDSLIVQLLKSTSQSTVKKNISKAFSDIIKTNSKTSVNNAINIIQSYYENYAKKYKIDSGFEKLQTNTKIKLKKEKGKETLLSSKDNENSKSNKSNIALEDNSTIKQGRRASLNNINLFSYPIKLDELTKKNYITNNKGRASEDLSQKKNYYDFFEDNTITNIKNQSIEKNNNIKSTENIFKKLTIPSIIQKYNKKNNSTLDILTGNSNIFFNNKKSIFKNTFTNFGKYNKILYIRNKKKQNILYKMKYLGDRSKSEFNHTYHIKGGVNFKRMLSRDYLNRLGAEKVDGVYSTLTPSYDLVQPKCIMKVSYSNKTQNVNNSSFKGLGPEATFNMDKLYNKYNNHNPPKTFSIKKMTGRGKYLKTKLPLFMLNIIDRNSFNFFNEKNLKMNYYSNGELKQLISCLNEKKSFNFKLKEKPEEKDGEKKNFEIFAKKIFEKGIENNNNSKSFDTDDLVENKAIRSIPFRVNSLFKNFMAEYNRKGCSSEKIDGITFKNFKIANKIRARKLI